MRLGFTYDRKRDYLALGYDEEAVAELDRDDTIDAIEQMLTSMGHHVDRIGHARALAGRLAAGERWDLVFNIAEGVRGAARESQVPAMLDVFDIPYTFSDPLVMAVCLDKRLAKQVVAARRIATPASVAVEQLDEVAAIDLAFPLFAKPVAEGTSRGITAASRVTDRDGLMRTCRELLARYAQPVLVERFLPGREFTVGVIGTGSRAETLGVLEVLLVGDAEAGIYSYANKQLFEGRVEYRLASDAMAQAAAELALGAYRALGCRDAGRVDVRLDEAGRPSFIECNPLAGLNPEISDLAILARQAGLSFSSLIERIVASALERVPSARGELRVASDG